MQIKAALMLPKLFAMVEHCTLNIPIAFHVFERMHIVLVRIHTFCMVL
jgi:hypothetical protein